ADQPDPAALQEHEPRHGDRRRRADLPHTRGRELHLQDLRGLRGRDSRLPRRLLRHHGDRRFRRAAPQARAALMLQILQDNWLLFLLGQSPHGPIGGLVMTLFMATVSLALCFPFAIGLALARLSPYRWLRLPATAIVHTVRGLPLLMFVFWAYFA